MKQSITFDDLKWLLASLVLMLAPLAPHLSPWVPVLAAILGLWRYRIASQRQPLPPLRILLPLTLLGAAGILASYHTWFGRDASVALLVMMTALKLLESNSRRDFTLLIFLACFISLTGFLFSQSMLVGAYLIVPLTALTATLIGINHPNGTLPAHRKLRLAGLMLGQAAPVMLALFLLFPRAPGPLWGVPKDAYSGMAGLSDNMSPGSISQLSQSDAVAFRAEFQGKLPSPSQLYWRGPVFWHYDGRTWSPGMQAASLPLEWVDARRDEVSYTVTLEPHNKPWLFLLDMPATTPLDSTLSHDRQLLARQPVRTRTRYTGVSSLGYRLEPNLDPLARQVALQLPHEGNPRTRQLGKEWAAAGASSEAIVQRALNMFREQPFVYTLRPPLLGDDSVDEFLFSTRRGFCEHYAGSFVFLMRAAGIPARVATGYQGGEINPVGNYLIVRQADAHAWAEVWLPERGWVRVDPTAAVSPQRVEAGIAAALPAGEPVPMLVRGDFSLLRKLYLNWDALNNGWNQWVLGYNEKRQLELLSRLAGSQVSWQDMAVWLMASVGLIVLAISAAMLRGSRRRVDALQAAWLQFQRKLARNGIARELHEGPLDFGRRAAQQLPFRAAAISAIAARYAQLRYGRPATREQVEGFRQRIRTFRP